MGMPNSLLEVQSQLDNGLITEREFWVKVLDLAVEQLQRTNPEESTT